MTRKEWGTDGWLEWDTWEDPNDSKWPEFWSPTTPPWSAEAVPPSLCDKTVEYPATIRLEEATLQGEAISPNVLFNHTPLPPNASMPQGVNYRGQPGRRLLWQKEGEDGASVFYQHSGRCMWECFLGMYTLLSSGEREAWLLADLDLSQGRPHQRFYVPFSCSGSGECYGWCELWLPPRSNNNLWQVKLRCYFCLGKIGGFDSEELYSNIGGN